MRWILLYMLWKKFLKFLSRLYIFLDKENVNAINDIYNKEIDSELISPFDDKFRHVDLIIKTKKGNRYIVDPLTALIEI